MDLEGLSRQVASGIVSVPAACARIDSLLFSLSKHDFHRQIPPILPPLCSLFGCLLSHAQSQEAMEALSALLHPAGPLLTALLAATFQDGSIRLDVPHDISMNVAHLPAVPVTRSGQVQLNLVEYAVWMLLRQVLKCSAVMSKSFRSSVGNIPVEAGELKWPHEAGSQVYLKMLQSWLPFFLPASSQTADLSILNSQLIPKTSVGQAMVRRLQEWFTRTLLSLLSAPEVNVDLVQAVEQITVHLVDCEWWLHELAPWLVSEWKQWPLDGSSAILISLLHTIASLPVSLVGRTLCLQLGMSAWLEHQELTVQAMLAACSLGDRCDWPALATQVTPLASHAHTLLSLPAIKAEGEKERAIGLVHGWDRLAAELAAHGIALPILETAQDAVCRLYRITEADFTNSIEVKREAGHTDRLSLLKSVKSDPHASDHLVRSHEWAPLVPLCQWLTDRLNAYWLRFLAQHPTMPFQRHRWNLRFMASMRLWVILIGGWLLYFLFK